MSPPSRRSANILPPEGVPITFEISSAGARFGAQLLDIVITYGFLLLLFILLIWGGVWDWSFLATLGTLLFFFLRVPYYIFTELVWNGRTIGKRITKIRVISADGTRLTPHQIVARNLMKEVEVFLPVTTLLSGAFESGWTGLALAVWMILVLLVPLLNKKRQRLGDFVAGTLVVDQPVAVLLEDLATTSPPTDTGFVFDTSHLEIYGRFELQTLENILRTPPKSKEAMIRVADVAKTIQAKINYVDPVLPDDQWLFLSEFYRQQRAYLESRQLFGDTRENKFHDREENKNRGLLQ